MASKKKKKSARKSRRGKRRGPLVLLGLVAVAVVIFFGMRFLGKQAEVFVPTKISQRFASPGKGAGMLDSPRGVAVDAQGNIYVTDLGNARINKYAEDGRLLLSFGHLGAEPGKGRAGEFNEPSGVAVAPDGTIYVADAWNGRVQGFDKGGHPKVEFGGAKYTFYSPRNVATDREGNVYVADTGNSQIKVISPAGKLLKVVGGRGSGKGQFAEIFGLAINSKGEVFGADPGNGRIQKFSALPDLKPLADVKVPGWRAQTPFWPHLAVDAQDQIYAVDSSNHKLWVYDSELKYRASVGGGPGAVLFGSPVGVAVAPDGSVIVTDNAASVVLRVPKVEIPALR